MINKIITLLIVLPNFIFAQHTIKGVFTPAEKYKGVLLYKVSPTFSEYITHAEMQKDGSFEFKLDASNTSGMYRLVYALPQEDYNFDVIYNGIEDIELAFNSETGVTFKVSTENKLLESYTASMLVASQSIINYFRSGKKDTTALKKKFKMQRETQTRYEKLAKNTIVLHFIKANKPYIPKNYESVKTYQKNIKAHYFDNIDFNNTTLQSSSFLEERMINYVFGISADGKDQVANYKNNIDVFHNVIKTLPATIKRILLVGLWQEMVDLSLDSVANFISKNYLLDIAVLLKDTKLETALKQYSDVSVGNKAPDFTFTDDQQKTKKLSELTNAETYILVFWSSTCSHCLTELPKFQNYLKLNVKENVKVIAIGMEDDDKNWKKQIINYPEFTHVLGLNKWNNTISKSYNVNATPSFFVLDKNKTIVSKPKHLEELKAYFDK